MRLPLAFGLNARSRTELVKPPTNLRLRAGKSPPLLATHYTSMHMFKCPPLLQEGLLSLET